MQDYYGYSNIKPCQIMVAPLPVVEAHYIEIIRSAC
jgi:hypothetical protein